MKTLLTAVLAATVLSLLVLVPEPASAGNCVRARVIYNQPVYSAPTYVEPVYEKRVLAVEVQRDYYFSVGDAYRDSLLADAIAYRVLAAQGARPPVAAGAYVPRVPNGTYGADGAYSMGTPPSVPPDGGGPASRSEAAIKTEVPEGLAEVVKTSCLKCHAGGKNGIDLSDLSVVGKGARWESYGRTNTGNMPRGEKEISDAQVELFRQWAALSSKGFQPGEAPKK